MIAFVKKTSVVLHPAYSPRMDRVSGKPENSCSD